MKYHEAKEQYKEDETKALNLVKGMTPQQKKWLKLAAELIYGTGLMFFGFVLVSMLFLANLEMTGQAMHITPKNYSCAPTYMANQSLPLFEPGPDDFSTHEKTSNKREHDD